MRIVAGAARGRVVRLPSGTRIRPTADRVKESLFNILHSVEGCIFLDLFAGSGSVGLEALSRGALWASFVEKDPRLASALQASAGELGFGGRMEVIAAEAQRGLVRLAQQGKRFDIIFADPPYDRGLVSGFLVCPDLRDLLAAEGVIVVQHSVRETADPTTIFPWEIVDRRRYGDTVLSFLQGGLDPQNKTGKIELSPRQGNRP